jgi:hypothetical protein
MPTTPIPSELQEIFTEFPGKVSTIKSKHAIPIDAHMSYMKFHEEVDTENLRKQEKEILQESKKLFEKDTWQKDKKNILFKLAHLGTLESYQVLSKFLDYAEKEEQVLIVWTVLCSEECRMFLESELLEEDTGMLMSPAGGDGENLRYYFGITADNGQHFTTDQKKMIQDNFEKIAKEIKFKIEEIDLGDNYALFTALHPWDVDPDELVERGINACNDKTKFLRFHYFSGNLKKPDQKMITEYLDELSRNKNFPKAFIRLSDSENDEVFEALQKNDKLEATRLVQRFSRAGVEASQEYVDNMIEFIKLSVPPFIEEN